VECSGDVGSAVTFPPTGGRCAPFSIWMRLDEAKKAANCRHTLV